MLTILGQKLLELGKVEFLLGSCGSHGVLLSG